MYDELAKRLRRYTMGCVAYKLDSDFAAAVQEAADAIEVLSKKENTTRWIPVTEDLPKRNGSYLVYVYGEVTEMDFWHGKWHRLRDDYTKAVTHWMPLPQAPKEET